MAVPKYLLVLLVLLACYSYGAMAQQPQQKQQQQQQQQNETDSEEAAQLEVERIVNMCNETFHTASGYLVDLNTTGAFPDETDKTPMCFIRCYLNNIGILKEDELDRDKAIEMAWSTSDEALDECYQEVADRTNPCHKAYFLTRCVMMRNLVDTRTTNQ